MTGTDRPRQLPLDLGHEAGFSRDDIVVSDANRAAVTLIDRWPGWPSPVVVLAGPPGSGKSHLASIWRERSGARQLSMSDLSDAAGVASGPILVDDADREPVDETGLFHLINQVSASGWTLMLTARRFPAAWPVTLPDLISRLKAAATIEIGEPDDALLAGVMTKLFADRQVEVEVHVVQFLVRRIERSLATAIDIVGRIDRAALEQKSRITRALAAEIVNAADHGQTELDL